MITDVNCTVCGGGSHTINSKKYRRFLARTYIYGFSFSIIGSPASPSSKGTAVLLLLYCRRPYILATITGRHLFYAVYVVVRTHDGPKNHTSPYVHTPNWVMNTMFARNSVVAAFGSCEDTQGVAPTNLHQGIYLRPC